MKRALERATICHHTNTMLFCQLHRLVKWHCLVYLEDAICAYLMRELWLGSPQLCLTPCLFSWKVPSCFVPNKKGSQWKPFFGTFMFHVNSLEMLWWKVDLQRTLYTHICKCEETMQEQMFVVRLFRLCLIWWGHLWPKKSTWRERS